ncbi:uncharacterized protein LOC123527348 [Mercenaria mercenaria]|uniref:uncharacterized protein LOC123527348 n=1 Tax=Mercenaria mercenaria TaxID=6596 RepID=UPI00234F95BB|nr:uncharacterized protein LOC123527348 [Mercenaria mercenaria]
MIFYSILSDHERLLQYLRDLKIIDGIRNCQQCSKTMKLSKNHAKVDKQEWRCDYCLRVESIRINSIFEKSKLSLRMQMEILYFFATDIQVFEVEKFTDISHVTVIEWYKKLRQLCKLFLEKDPISLGNAEGSVVEIDESLFGKKKGNIIKGPANRTHGFSV